MGPSQVVDSLRRSVPASIGWAQRPPGAARGSLRGPDDRPHLPVRAPPTRPAGTGRTARVRPVAGPQCGGDQHVHAAGQAVRGPAPRRGRSAAGSRRACSGGACCDVRPRPRRPRVRSVRSGRGATRPRAGRGPARATRRPGASGRRAAATGPAAPARWRPRSARRRSRPSGCRTRDAVPPCAGSGAERAGGGVGRVRGGVRRAPGGVGRGRGGAGPESAGVDPA
jgi:hypothetical protein